MSIKSLRKRFIKLKNSKANVKLLMIELLRDSSNDYTTERMAFHLYKCGMHTDEGSIYKYFIQLEQEFRVIFVGYMPVYTENNNVCIGSDPMFGLAANLKKE